jgi:hypothetical protein
MRINHDHVESEILNLLSARRISSLAGTASVTDRARYFNDYRADEMLERVSARQLQHLVVPA